MPGSYAALTDGGRARGAWALVPAAIAPVALIGGWTVAAGRQPPAFDPTRDTISALAAHGANDRWIMTGSLAAVGVCYLSTATLLGPARRTGRAMLAAGGVAVLGVAAFAQPSAAHAPVASAAFVTLTVWPVLARVPSGRFAVAISSVLAGLLAGFAIALAADVRVGLVERVLSAAQALAPLLVAGAVLTRGAGPQPAPAGPASSR